MARFCEDGGVRGLLTDPYELSLLRGKAHPLTEGRSTSCVTNSKDLEHARGARDLGLSYSLTANLSP